MKMMRLMFLKTSITTMICIYFILMIAAVGCGMWIRIGPTTNCEIRILLQVVSDLHVEKKLI